MDRPRVIFPASLVLMLAVLIAGCGGAQAPGASDQLSREAAAAPKRIRVAIMGDPPTLSNAINSGGGAGVPGATALTGLVNAGLMVQDDTGTRRAQLAETLPTVENGLWKILAEGGMETTWRIRPGVEWHDGTAFSSDDILFSARVARDKSLAVFGDIAYDSITRIEAPDARTVLVRWSRPYVDADAMFDAPAVMPKHILEHGLGEEKATFIQLPYWSEEFVGTGPFVLRGWERGSHLILEANPRYALGRPKIDEIEVRTIPDPNALAANILAGGVELTLDRNLSLEQALQVGSQWSEGKALTPPSSWLVMYPQLLSPNPAVVGDVRFRRALIEGIDRQEMADTLLGPGLSSVAHNFLDPKQPEYAAIQPSVVRYSYDPGRAAQGIEALGFTRGADGFYRGGQGPLPGGEEQLRSPSRVQALLAQPLGIEVRNRGIEIGQRATLAVADAWQHLGIRAEPVIVPPQRGQDREYMSNFPGVLLYNQPTDVGFLKRIHSSQTPLPENAYVGQNNSRYMSPQFDALIERVFNTIPWDARMDALGQVVHQLTDQLLLMGLFYNVIPVMMGNRLVNVPPDSGRATWNAHEWDVRS